MNKFAKGSLAAGAGIALLLGGAGTLAYWNDTAELTGGTISAGTLTLDAANGTWYEGGVAIEDVEQFALVPGDTLTYKVDLELDAKGDNIQGTIALDQSLFDIGAADQITVDLETPTLPDGITVGEQKDTLTFAEAYEGTIPVEVTVNFPFNPEAEQNSSKGAIVDLEDITFTATQTPANGALKTPVKPTE